MSLTEPTKDEYTFKKAINREHTATAKEWHEENPGEGFLIPNTRVWKQADEIPSTPPGSSTSLIDVYAPLQLTEDTTVSGKKCWRCKTGETQHRNFVPPTFALGYAVHLYTDVGMSNEVFPSVVPWIFDYENGILVFENTQTYSNLYLKCYRYKGGIGKYIKLESVSSLPTGEAGRMVFRTTDDRPYVYIP